MRSHDLKRAKRDVRREILARRDALDAVTIEAAGEAVAERVLATEVIAPGAVVLVYWSFGSELPTSPLRRRLREAGATVALPRIDGDRLRTIVFDEGDPMTATSFGAMEPTGGDEVAPGDLALIATPAVAFDLAGRRIGYGGGFYDRLFPLAATARRVGVAHDVQVVEGPLPAGHFDLRVQAVCTPTRTIACGAPT
jgi:5-formyltetrahydrofolate cyclo-ligase